MEITHKHADQNPLPNQGGVDARLQATKDDHFSPPIIAHGAPDLNSLFAAIIGGAVYFLLAYFSISLSRFDMALPTIWLPSAIAVAFLLRMKLANEVGFYAAILPASLFANAFNGNALDVSLIFAAANMASILVVSWLTRKYCGPDPDMSDLSSLARFVWTGGMVGPLIAASIAALAMMPGLPFDFITDANNPWTAFREGVTSWFLTESMGMVMIVPTALLIGDALSSREIPSFQTISECSALLASSLLCVVLVFGQSAYPLLFLIIPMTLVHAFRLGSIGTALHVALVAVVSTAMTWSGYGPIVATSPSPNVQLFLLQAFIAANFLTGIPIAAILAGRERLTEELAAGRREMALLADSITDAVLKLDANGVCTYASPSVSEVLGKQPDEFIGQPLTTLTNEDAGQRIRDAISRLIMGKADKERLTYRRKLDDEDGVAVFVEADCAISFDPVTGAREGVVISARDVTERVELELLLTRARRHAENAARAKSDFLANMSHEIRTPMNGVLGFAELMLQGQLDPEQRRQTEMIVESGRSMMLLLNDVLDLSKIEAGQITISPAPIDLHMTLEQCLILHRQSAEAKGLSLHLECEGDRHTLTDDERPNILADGLRLRQIVLNLIGNAVKFTDNGEICVSYWVDGEELGVRVRDSGIGIEPDQLTTIFQPFRQGESDPTRSFGGTGLGLSISQQLAGLLGGVIDVDSEAGVGSTFTLTLPTALAPPQEGGVEPPEPVMPENLPQEARILLVEDHDVNRMLIAEMLEQCGQSVAIAHDGNEAISMVIDSVLRARPYDLVLMDIQMPECDGYSATRTIREEGIGPDDLPIIAITANAFPEDIAAARKAGMQGHLAKPIVFADLAKMLLRWLPTRIVEAPMDRDITPETLDINAPLVPLASDQAITSANETRSSPSSPTPSASLLERWLERRFEAIEAVRTALADGLICNKGKRRATDQEEREELLRIIHKLAGSAASFGEAELGEQAAKLEHAMRAQDASCEGCEELAFELLSLADEPVDELTSTDTASKG